MRIAFESSIERAVEGARRFPGAAWLDGDGRASGGRMSHLACEPVETLRSERTDGSALTEIAHALEASPSSSPRPRWIGYLTYELGRSRERRTIDDRRPIEPGPTAWWARYDAVATFDHATGRAWIDADDGAAAERLARRLGATERRAPDVSLPLTPTLSPFGERGPGPVIAPRPMDVPPLSPQRGERQGRALGELRSDVDRTAHVENVRRALDHIAAGDVYQVNVTRRITVTPAPDVSFALARAMRRASPVPYGAWLDAGDHAIVGRSPELFLAWDRPGRTLSTRPIKGTLAHLGGRSFADASERLRGDPKEHAEHVMIVDMARNDLGRVAVTGSVEVPAFLEVERFAELDHLVSTVTCRSRADVSLADVLDATFPGASVTGAPKVAAMDLIAEIERSRRGLYTGAYGYVACDGSLVLAMAIRTAVVRDGSLVYGTGGGIVAASDPAREWDETVLKARALSDALTPSPPIVERIR
ncbi:MAG: chorismate-binding protein [Deltaproteobacteria bacterium]|nr:chorismate-binding protein [Deltaproteobacteria bacterium]